MREGTALSGDRAPPLSAQVEQRAVEPVPAPLAQVLPGRGDQRDPVPVAGHRGHHVGHGHPVRRPVEHPHLVTGLHLRGALHGQVAARPTGLDEPLDQVRDVAEAGEHPARDPRPRTRNTASPTCQRSPSTAPEQSTPANGEVLPHPARVHPLAQLGRPEREILARVGVHRLVRAAVVAVSQMVSPCTTARHRRTTPDRSRDGRAPRRPARRPGACRVDGSAPGRAGVDRSSRRCGPGRCPRTTAPVTVAASRRARRPVVEGGVPVVQRVRGGTSTASAADAGHPSGRAVRVRPRTGPNPPGSANMPRR